MYSSKITRSLRSSEYHLLSTTSAGGHLIREGPDRMSSPSARACGRAQRTMGGERGLRRRRPVSGLLATHIPPLFPRRPRVSPASSPTKRFRRAAPRPRPRGRREEATGGGAAAGTEGEPPPAVLRGGLCATIRMGSHCLRATLQARTAGITAHTGHPPQSTRDPPNHSTFAHPKPGLATPNCS